MYTLRDVINGFPKEEFYRRFILRVGETAQFPAFLADPESVSEEDKDFLRGEFVYAGINESLLATDEDLFEAAKLIMSRAVQVL